MNDLKIFQNEQFGSVRTIEKDSKIYFCGSDVAKALGYSNPRDAIARHCKADGVVKHDVVSETVNQHGVATQQNVTMNFINEGNVYRLITHSKLPAAEQFEHWVFDEVLPSIRKQGAYMTPETLEQAILNPDYLIKLATALKEEKDRRQVLETENAQQKQIIGELKPRADYTDRILSNKGLVTITQIAKDYGMSGRKMNKLLEDLHVQYKQSGQWLLYADYHDKGYTHSKTINITRKDGTPDVTMETKWTQKGRLFIYDLLKSKDILPTIEQEQTKKSA